MIYTVDAGTTWTEWCGQLPASWAAMELRRVADISASNVDKISQEGEIAVRLCNYTDVYYHDVITPDLEFMEATASPSEIARFRLRGGEVLLTKDSETAEDIAIPAYVRAGIEDVVCGYHLYLLRPQLDKVDGRFLMWACSVSPVKDQFVIAANGITRFGLGQQDLGSSLVPVPPLRVQRDLADFLDRETTKIDHLVEEKQRLIELLEEKRTALITQAVTKGLDPHVEMKDSGVEWLGEIPAHWDLRRLVHCCRSDTPIVYGILKPGFNVPGGVPYVGAGDVTPSRLRLELLPRTTPEISREFQRSIVKAGELVYAIRGSFGNVEVVPTELQGANLSRDAARIAPRPTMIPSWLAWVLKSAASQAQFRFLSLGSAVTGVNIRDLKRILVAVPPASEQEDIANFLEQEAESLASLCDAIVAATDLLREYRTALISAAVTGKIDVREEVA